MGWIERKTRFNDTRLPDASLRAEDQKRPSSGGSENMKHQHAHTHIYTHICSEHYARAKRRHHIISLEHIMTHIHHLPHSGKHLTPSEMRDKTAALETPVQSQTYCRQAILIPCTFIKMHPALICQLLHFLGNELHPTRSCTGHPPGQNCIVERKNAVGLCHFVMLFRKNVKQQ